MKIHQKYSKIVKEIIFAYKKFVTKKKVVFFSLIALPITSVSAGMSLYVDNISYESKKPVIANDIIINLDEQLSVQFAQPVTDVERYNASITVYPNEQLAFSWNVDNTTLTITPKSIWKPATQYSFTFPADSYKSVSELSYIYSFETEQYPQILQTNVNDDEQFFYEGDEIIITFDQKITNYDVQAVARPFISSTQYTDEQNNQLHILIKERPTEYQGPHNLTVFAKHKAQSTSHYFPVGTIGFTTLMASPETWPKKFDERLDIARKSTAPTIKTGKYIDVNLSSQVTTLFENGIFVTNFVNSPGAEDTPTPKGNFQIYNKNPYALSNMFQVYMPYWMAFTANGEYGFHDLVVWPEGHDQMPSGGKESISSIGRAVSPGCVRHDAKNSKFIYDWTNIGTKVVIY